MFVSKNSLDKEFANNIKFLEYKYGVIILLQRELDGLHANILERNTLETIAIFFLGDSETTKERMYVRLSRKLKEFAKTKLTT